MLIAVAMMTSSVWSGCDDAASSISQNDNDKTCGQCADHQVCAQNGVCYDDAACATCSATQICVSGTCYDANSPCGACGPKQICVSDTCFDANDPCAKCSPTQVCVSGACHDASDPCAACSETQVCLAGSCYDANDPCALCSENQICLSGSCYDANGPCGACHSDQYCVDNACSDFPEGHDANSCIPACSSGSRCVKGKCEPCPSVCGGTCCDDDQVCDKVTRTCTDLCADGNAPCDGECCRDDQFCEPVLGCMLPCADTEISCPNYDMNVLNCCGTGLVCENSFCIKDCGSNARCGRVCCQDGEVCEDGTCKVSCEHGERCGVSEEYCCNSDTEICIFNACHPRGKACTTANNCSFDEYCDDATMSCVNTDIVPATCQVIPKFEKFEARPQWHWPDSLPGGKSAFSPEYNQVMMTPVVINMTDDNNDSLVDENDVPDVIFASFKGGSYNSPGVIHVISGDDGRELAGTTPIYHSSDDFGAADIDGDGVPELIASTATEIHALSLVKDASAPTGYAWKVKYKIAHGQSSVQRLYVSFANLENDGIVDIVTSLGVLNVVDNALVWKEGCHTSLGRPAIADLNGDGVMEIINNYILNNHCKRLDSVSHGGFVAVADLMPDSTSAEELGELKPELARVVSGALEGSFQFYKVYVKDDVWTTKLVWSAPIPINYARAKALRGVDCKLAANKNNGNCNSGGGPLVIADFNGDGTPDVGVAARWYYIVYSNDGTPNGGKVLWAHSQTQDYSSAVTGSSVFDFEGDGVAEVVYADETRLRVYSGPGLHKDLDGDGYDDPDILYDIPNSSGTLWEYPLIVDVDNDGSTEIVVVSNNYAFKPVTGVRAFEDPGGQWVRTRRIWNQHHYHVTNINENGSVPAHEEINWLHPKLNNYRQNVQPGGVYNAPNLVAKTLTEDLVCSQTETHIKLTATIANEGSLSVKAGLKVTFYAKNVNGTDKTVRIAEAQNDKVLSPGGSASVTYDWNGKAIVDGVETDIKMPALIYYVIDEPTKEKQFGEFVECIETDNTLDAVMMEGCEIIY